MVLRKFIAVSPKGEEFSIYQTCWAKAKGMLAKGWTVKVLENYHKGYEFEPDDKPDDWQGIGARD